MSKPVLTKEDLRGWAVGEQKDKILKEDSEDEVYFNVCLSIFQHKKPFILYRHIPKSYLET